MNMAETIPCLCQIRGLFKEQRSIKPALNIRFCMTTSFILNSNNCRMLCSFSEQQCFKYILTEKNPDGLQDPETFVLGNRGK